MDTSLEATEGARPGKACGQGGAPPDKCAEEFGAPDRELVLQAPGWPELGKVGLVWLFRRQFSWN